MVIYLEYNSDEGGDVKADWVTQGHFPGEKGTFTEEQKKAVEDLSKAIIDFRKAAPNMPWEIELTLHIESLEEHEESTFQKLVDVFYKTSPGGDKKVTALLDKHDAYVLLLKHADGPWDKNQYQQTILATMREAVTLMQEIIEARKTVNSDVGR